MAPDIPGMQKRRCTCCFMSRITSPRSVLQHVSAKERLIRNQYSRPSCFMFLRNSEVVWVIPQFTEDGHKYQLLSSRKPDNRTHGQQHGEMGKCYIQFSWSVSTELSQCFSFFVNLRSILARGFNSKLRPRSDRVRCRTSVSSI